MRVEIAVELEESSERLELPWENPGQGTRYFDLREDPRAIARVEPARRNVPLRAFLVAVNSDDSFFASARAKTWKTQDESASAVEPFEFAFQVDLVFALEQFNFERGHFENVARQLEQLLARDTPGDAMRSRLCVRACHFRASGRWGFCLACQLFARGASAEQAELRWGLVLARLQQALLFVSRVVRQQIAQVS